MLSDIPRPSLTHSFSLLPVLAPAMIAHLWLCFLVYFQATTSASRLQIDTPPRGCLNWKKGFGLWNESLGRWCKSFLWKTQANHFIVPSHWDRTSMIEYLSSWFLPVGCGSSRGIGCEYQFGRRGLVLCCFRLGIFVECMPKVEWPAAVGMLGCLQSQSENQQMLSILWTCCSLLWHKAHLIAWHH